MKIAFSTLACPQWPIEQTVENAVRMGYTGIELRLLGDKIIDPVADYQEVVRVVNLSRAHGLDVCALDTSCQFNRSNPEERQQQVTDLLNWIRLAQDTHVPILRVFGGANPSTVFPQPTEVEVNTWVADSLQKVASFAESASVTIVLETHDAFSSARRVANVLQSVNSPNIAALWDSHHPYRVGESAQDVIAALNGRIGHVHIKDARRVTPQSADWQLVLLGEGEVPVQDQLTLLKQHNYTGYISVEWEKKWHPEIPAPEVALPQHIDWLKTHHFL